MDGVETWPSWGDEHDFRDAEKCEKKPLREYQYDTGLS